ncbi:MAG: hypothetical protein RKO66_01580 [Candidatus Contendobacter sp.]|nr:hypothetical protein [Candidatus Contendobacter sp.]MDS4058408.1 hypothetical protein [Candidatus Contendobacter sp.]
MDLDFQRIVPRCGGQREAFEELCCQLAHWSVPKEAPYVRLHGAGGDGGVECFSDLTDGSRVGWQAKYVFDIGALLTQATGSLTTALNIHPKLTQYIVCFPFDLTGPTGRKGLSGQEKFDNWRKEHEKKASAKARPLTIEAWPAYKLRELLLEYDASGGVREFFFNQRILTSEWFSEHLGLAKRTAGPRYTPELNVKTELWKWFGAFGHTAVWSDEFKSKIRVCWKANERLVSALRRVESDRMSPAWPEESREAVQSLTANTEELLNECDRLVTIDDQGLYKDCCTRIGSLLDSFESTESHLVKDLEAKHGKGKADSPGFRQFMAEYMVSFPAANLDYTREAITALTGLREWLLSPACSLAYESVFVLSGIAGSGKTHGICDAADYRLGQKLLTCITFGHEFRGEPDPWTRILETLGLSVTLGMNGLLDALNAAGEASGSALILYIDAINETRPLRYWRDRLSAVSQAIHLRPFLRLCVTCRTSFLSYCLPDQHNLPVVEHTGFAGIERDACQAFFRYYGLEPPISPILQPEFSNPLYLRLVCETLQSRGLRRMPSGWHGLAPTIRAFLGEKERQFSAEYETSQGANIVSGALMAIVRAIVENGESALSWTQAQRVVSEARPQASTLPVLEWLVRADLLVEDAPTRDDLLGDESVVRPAFERLGDFLVAAELLEKSSQTGLEAACQPGGLLRNLFKDYDALEQHSGILAALSILIAEKNPGVEFSECVDDESIRNSLVRIVVRSFPSRDPSSFTASSGLLARESLGWADFSFEAMDSLLAISWQPSAIDAIWLDKLLKQQLLARRDAYWCGYLHDRFESHSMVRRLINAAFELPLDHLEHDIAERWCTMILWFTAAADRRVKDWATRASTAILSAQPQVLPHVLKRFLVCDDDEVRERTLLSCYGALIFSRDAYIVQQVTASLQETYRSEPRAFDNALIRDQIRCISELAIELNVLPQGCDSLLTMQPIDSEWPQQLPSNDQIEAWGNLLHFRPDEFFSDFFKYSMNCLRPWVHSFSKKDMGAWILQRVVRDFGYEGSGCERYDGYMLGKHGGGRGKPTWAERIGKKYQWVGMYQLASRLHDHIKREQDSWEPAPLRSPFILLEERKLDPTLPHRIAGSDRNHNAWWIGDSVNLQLGEQMSDTDWVNFESDLPSLDKLLSTKECSGQSWLLLASYLSWDDRPEDADCDQQYRHVWIHVESYLVTKNEVAIGYNCLHRRNFFGQWMKQGASWLYGFAGEYPWATSFNIETDAWNSIGGFGRQNPPVVYTPAWNELAVEWEYDASLGKSFHMLIPARAFFSPSDLWWNGLDGYSIKNGKSVFRDISVSEVGPRALIADIEDLQERLDRLGLRLIWTLLGEKWILGGHHDKATPRRTFSQIARLTEDGSIQIGDRVFFNDYDKDTGPTTASTGRR